MTPVTIATVHSTDGTQTRSCFYIGRMDRDDMLRKAFDYIWSVTGQTASTDFDKFTAGWDWDNATVEEVPHWGGLYK